MSRLAACAILALAVARPWPAAGQNVPQHVLTADYLGAPYGSTRVTPAQAAPYLTWAQVTVRDANAVSAAGIKTQYYIDPALTIADRGDQLYTADETTFAHDCAGNRVTIPYHSLTEDLMALEQPSMRAVFRHWVTRVTSVAHFDALFEDDADLPSEYVRFRPLPCNYGDAQWLRALDGLNRVSPIPVILSGLNASRRPAPSGIVALLSSGATLGENYEHCYSSDGQPKMTGTLWQAIENSEIRVTAAHKTFECMARDGADAAASVDARTYLYASFLLTYDPVTSVIWEEYATPSRFRVEPESGLVALSPLERSPADVGELRVNGGAYARRFARCYLGGRFAGGCAAVVNADDSPHPFPFGGYRRTLVLAGGGVLDGGTASANGPPPPAQLAPAQAVIAFR
jgi:hypothetical protein